MENKKPEFKENAPSREYKSAPVNVPTDEELNSERRRLVKMQSKFELPAGKEALPLKNDEHVYCLLNLTYTGHRPLSPYPGFRILGCFPTEAALRLHIEKYYSGEQECSSWLTLSHQLMPICTTTEKQTNKVYSEAHVRKLADFYTKSCQDSDDDFKSNVEQGKTGSNGKSLYALEKKRNEQNKNDTPSPRMLELPKTPFLSSVNTIMGQNFAVVVVLRDLRPEVVNLTLQAEPVIAILDVFSTLEDAIFYAKYTASKAYPLCSIDTVDLYQWIFPEHVDTDSVPEVYANEDLEHIMAGRKDSIANCAKYEKYCEETKNVPEVIDTNFQTDQTLEEQFKKFGKM